MPAALFLLAGLVFGFAARADTGVSRGAPSYSATSIVNAADNQPGWLAPNAIGTLYGVGLAFTTKALSANDIQSGTLPTVLPGTGVRVLIGNLPANIYFVSPGQINFLVPSILLPGKVDVQVVIDGTFGPAISVQLAPAAPALFEADAQNIVATRADGSVVTSDSPARPGDYVVLYATGMGPTAPPVPYGQLPTAAAALTHLSDLTVLLDGVAVDQNRIAYAGVAPGFAGLYQINVKLPDSTGSNPEIRVSIANQASRPGIRLPVRP